MANMNTLKATPNLEKIRKDKKRYEKKGRTCKERMKGNLLKVNGIKCAKE